MRGAELIQRSIAALNRQDAQAYAAGFTPDAVVQDPAYPDPLKGQEAVAEDIEALLQAFPDAAATVLNVFDDGDVLAAEVEIRGTHEGPWHLPDGVLAPTGRRLVLRTCDIVEVGPDGRYAAERRYYDLAGVLAQLGATR